MAQDETQDENAPRAGLTTLSSALANSLKRVEKLRETLPPEVRAGSPLSVVPYKAPPPKVTITREQMVRQLLALDVIFPSQMLSPEQMTMRFHIFYEDLRRLSEDELIMACERYRRDPASKFFPHPGALLALTRY